MTKYDIYSNWQALQGASGNASVIGGLYFGRLLVRVLFCLARTGDRKTVVGSVSQAPDDFSCILVPFLYR